MHATTTEEIFAGRAEDPYTLAVRAYVWGYPLVSSAGLRQALTNPSDPFVRRPPTSPGAALNHLGLQEQLSDPRTLGLGVNVDTLYALAWLDLADTPFVLETPDFGGRYYTFQMAQADTSAEASFGQRTHGSQLPPLFIHGPGYEGTAPKGMLGVRSSSRYFLVAGRILVDPSAPGDFDTVHALQRRIQLRPARDTVAPSDPPAQRPLLDANRGIDPALSFLEQLGNVLRDFDTTRTSEAELVRSLAQIGLTTRSGFDPGRVERRRHGRARPRPPRRSNDRPRQVAQPGRQRQWLDDQLPGSALRHGLAPARRRGPGSAQRDRSRRSALSTGSRGQRRRRARRSERVSHPLRPGPTAARRGVLVDHHLRRRRSPGGQPDRSVRDRGPDARLDHQPRRLAGHLHPEHGNRRRARPTGSPRPRGASTSCCGSTSRLHRSSTARGGRPRSSR